MVMNKNAKVFGAYLQRRFVTEYIGLKRDPKGYLHA